MNLDILKQRFDRDLTPWKPIPFWSWNAELEPEKLKQQIDRMNRDGIGGFFMHARGGLKTDYLSEEWMNCVRICTEYAEKLGMDAWAYDENGWPSGFAGGKLLEDEKNRDRYIDHAVGAFDPEATVSYRIDGERIVRTDKPGEGEYLNLYLRTSTSTADILNPEVVEKFLTLTHEEYKKAFGGKFPERMRGFFTDEPQYYRWGTPFTDCMVDFYRETYGEDLFDGLGLLFVEKEGYRRFRYRYWKSMQALMLRAFGKMTYEWCDKNGIKLTGHYVEESTMGMQMFACAGIMPFYEYEHIPGVDWLGCESENEILGRQVGSAARQMGRRQVLTESFGCCGWQVAPADLKRIAESQFVNGVNLLCHHLMPYAEYGQRKRDYPAHYSPVNPWVNREFADFNRYFTRLGHLLAESDETVNVAMLHPMRSVYFDYKRDAEPNGYNVSALDRALVEDCRALSSRGINYHFLDETLLAKHGFVNGGKIGCGKCTYDYLVIPHMLTMDATTEQLLRSYAENGGKILLMGEKPSYLEGDSFCYDYLESNCTLEEILAAQPCRMSGGKHGIYCTFRTLDGQNFIFAQNSSKAEDFTQTFDLGNDVRSFLKLDLLNMTTERVPLTLHFAPGESALLFPDTTPAESLPTMPTVDFVPNCAKASFAENALTVDQVRYSTDGANFSKKYPVRGLFAKLLEDRYEGTLYLKYEFDVRELPAQLTLKAEECGGSEFLFNGTPFAFAGADPTEDHLLTADVTAMVKKGFNDFTVKLNWHQSEIVYYALFGENVTESLVNCLAYDTELEAVYLTGKFGVYSDTPFADDPNGRHTVGSGFYIGLPPEVLTEPVKDGLPFFAGELSLTQTVLLDSDRVLLNVPGNYQMAYVSVNGSPARRLLFTKQLDLTGLAKPGENEIEVRYIISNFNLLGPHHYKEILHYDFAAPDFYELVGKWDDGKSPEYFDPYIFLMLNAK